MSNNFYVGQKVVCVAEADVSDYPECAGIVLNEVYTIREIADYGGIVGLRLVEVVNPPGRYREAFAEPIFCLTYFRPAVSQFDFASLVTPASLDKFKREDEQSQPKRRKRVSASRQSPAPMTPEHG